MDCQRSPLKSGAGYQAASHSLPIDNIFDFQVGVLSRERGNGTFVGGASHFFTRDPNVGSVGVYGGLIGTKLISESSPGDNCQSVCLNMIVKNEAPIIRRCLDSARPIINHWIIVDTGSTDGTQDLIRAHLGDLPVAFTGRPCWRTFATNRTEALALARFSQNYTLIIDAGDDWGSLRISSRPTSMPAPTHSISN